MSNSGRKKPRLVADKRYSAPKKKPARKTGKPGRRKPAARKAPARRGLLSLPMRLIGWGLRLVWGIGWRLSAVMALIVGVAVAYTYATLPSVDELLDGSFTSLVVTLACPLPRSWRAGMMRAPLEEIPDWHGCTSVLQLDLQERHSS